MPFKDEAAAKAYKREWYKRNRAILLARAKARVEANPEAYKEYQSAYRREWLAGKGKEHYHKYKEYYKDYKQKNKSRANARRRESAPERKAKEEALLANSEMIGTTEAANILGMPKARFRHLVATGRVPSTKTPTGYYLVEREYITQLTMRG